MTEQQPAGPFRTAPATGQGTPDEPQTGTIGTPEQLDAAQGAQESQDGRPATLAELVD